MSSARVRAGSFTKPIISVRMRRHGPVSHFGILARSGRVPRSYWITIGTFSVCLLVPYSIVPERVAGPGAFGIVITSSRP
jgi:hypothetical protein